MKTITIPWNNQSNRLWNDLCADVVEYFGLPGNKYTTSITDLEMEFHFKNEKDAFLCEILLSEYLTSA